MLTLTKYSEFTTPNVQMAYPIALGLAEDWVDNTYPFHPFLTFRHYLAKLIIYYKSQISCKLCLKNITRLNAIKYNIEVISLMFIKYLFNYITHDI